MQSPDADPRAQLGAVRAAHRRIGAPLPDIGLSLWLAAGFYAALFAAVFSFLAFSSFSRRVELEGVLAPVEGLAEVSTRQAGVVSALHVKEGQPVEAGERLATMSVDLYGRNAVSIGGILEEALTARRRAADLDATAKALTLVKERADVAAQMQNHAQKADLLVGQRQRASERIARTQQRLASLKDLRLKGYVSNLQVQQMEDALTEQQMQLLSIEQQRVALESEQARLVLVLNELGARVAQNEAAAADAKAGVLEKQAAASSQQELILVAPRRGRVAALRVKQGDTVVAGAVVATVAPERLELRAEFRAPSRAIGFLRRGDDVRLKFAAFPYEVFGFGKGRIDSVSVAPVGDQSLPSGGIGEPVYAVRVGLERNTVRGYGRDWPLTPGMRVSGVVTLEKRTMLDWLLAPVTAARARMAG